MFVFYFPLIVYLLAASSMILSFPVMLLWGNFNLGLCLFCMGLTARLVMGWFTTDEPIDSEQDNIHNKNQ